MNPSSPKAYPLPYGEPDQPADTGKLMALTKEYTTTLRETCQRELDRRVRYETLVLAFLVVSVVVSFWVFSTLRDNPTGTLLGGLVVGLMVVTLMILAYSLAGRPRYSEHADELARTVGRLIELASQYREHASKRIADKFEFDLRLDEADAVMRTYKRVFKPRKSD